MANDITVDPSNSPYQVPAGVAAYGTVTIEPGGTLLFTAETELDADTLVKDETKLK